MTMSAFNLNSAFSTCPLLCRLLFLKLSVKHLRVTVMCSGNSMCGQCRRHNIYIYTYSLRFLYVQYLVCSLLVYTAFISSLSAFHNLKVKSVYYAFSSVSDVGPLMPLKLDLIHVAATVQNPPHTYYFSFSQCVRGVLDKRNCNKAIATFPSCTLKVFLHMGRKKKSAAFKIVLSKGTQKFSALQLCY